MCLVNIGKKGVKETKSLIDCFVEDFEAQYWALSEKTKLFLSLERRKLLLLYTFDLFICHLIIGNFISLIVFNKVNLVFFHLSFVSCRLLNHGQN